MPLQHGAARAGDGAEDPFIGVELDGQIEIKALLGVGAMGRVYRAFQGGIERDVAVKILRPELVRDRNFIARFHREAKIASRLDHPGVVQIFMSGTVPKDSTRGIGGELYLAMEYLSGISLLSAFAAAAGAEGVDRALPVSRALKIILQVCDAVGEAHLRGIVHRDIKPENVMLIPRGKERDYVKVLDFGIARLQDDRSMWTEAGLVFGSAPYISPEGAQGETVGPAGDVYSIACLLFECLSGQTPFQDDSPVRLLLQHVQKDPPDLRSIARSAYVPEPIADVVMRSLAKNPQDRLPTAKQLGVELANAARRSGLDVDALVVRTDIVSPDEAPIRWLPRTPTKGVDWISPGPRGEQKSLDTLLSEVEDLIDEEAAAPVEQPEGERSDRRSSVGERSRAPRASSDLTESGLRIRPTSLDSEMGGREGDSTGATDETESETTPPSDGPVAASGPLNALSISRRRLRWTAIIWLMLVLIPTALLVWREVGVTHDELEDEIATARRCMDDGAWSAEGDQSPKVMLDRISKRWPRDERVERLRSEAAQRLVAHALRLKYAEQEAEAKELLELALSLSPQLPEARGLLREISGEQGSDGQQEAR